MTSKLKILEQYQDYSPPIRVNEAVRLLVRHIPEEHLKGLHKIVLTNSASVLSSIKGKQISEGRRFRPADCLGLYSNGHIFLVLDHILSFYPETLLLVPMIKTLVIGETLYHEVGHHIHSLEQPGYRANREVFADEWKDKLLTAFFTRRYWYLAAPLRAYVRLIHPRLVRSGRPTETEPRNS